MAPYHSSRSHHCRPAESHTIQIDRHAADGLLPPCGQLESGFHCGRYAPCADWPVCAAWTCFAGVVPCSGRVLPYSLPTYVPPRRRRLRAAHAAIWPRPGRFAPSRRIAGHPMEGLLVSARAIRPPSRIVPGPGQRECPPKILVVSRVVVVSYLNTAADEASRHRHPSPATPVWRPPERRRHLGGDQLQRLQRLLPRGETRLHLADEIGRPLQ